MTNRKPLGVLGVAFVFLGLGLVWHFSHTRGIHGKANQSRITISKETTWLTEPIDGEGYVDYLSAINEIAGAGVAPEDNAAVPLVEAFGPEFLPGCENQFCRLLGIPPLRPRDGTFIPLDRFDKRSSSTRPSHFNHEIAVDSPAMLNDQLARAMARPWSREEFPRLARWLQENERHLESFVAASRRRRCYWPLVKPATSAGIAAAACRSPMHFREASNALAARAMLRLHANDLSGAWEDLEACHRLSRLIARGPTLADLAHGLTLHGLACQADIAIVVHGAMTSRQAMARIARLQALPSWPNAAEKVHRFERLILLGTIAELARSGAESNRDLRAETPGLIELDSPSQLDGEWIPGVDRLGVAIGRAATDWDEALRLANVWIDRMSDALAKPDRAERIAGTQKLYRQLSRPASSGSLLEQFADAIQSRRSPHKALAERVVQAVMPRIAPMLAIVPLSQDRAEPQFRLLIAALSLAAYRADHGEFPETLDRLCPKYLAEVPRDVYGDGSLKYRRVANGAIVYSVGANTKDDGGRSRVDRIVLSATFDEDDLAVELTANRAD